jgi:hypothetical protein
VLSARIAEQLGAPARLVKVILLNDRAYVRRFRRVNRILARTAPCGCTARLRILAWQCDPGSAALLRPHLGIDGSRRWSNV